MEKLDAVFKVFCALLSVGNKCLQAKPISIKFGMVHCLGLANNINGATRQGQHPLTLENELDA